MRPAVVRVVAVAVPRAALQVVPVAALRLLRVLPHPPAPVPLLGPGRPVRLVLLARPVRAVCLTATVTGAGSGVETEADMDAGRPVPDKEGARDTRASISVIQDLRYPGLDGTVTLEDADEVLAALDALMTGWHPDVTIRHGITAEPDHRISMIRRAGSRMDLHSPWLDEPMKGLRVASAACGVVADISQAFCNQHRDCIGLHCGAVQINGQLVVLTGPARAGKSTLISRLTAEPDMTVFCDDILPVLEDGLAFGLGLAPRLRLPLPENASAAFRAHVATYMGPADNRYGYLCGPNIAPHGTRAPVVAFIVLARVPDGPASLHHMGAAEAVQHLVRQNISAPGEGAGQFDQVTRMAQSLACLKLAYSDLEDAVALLRQAFGGAGLGASGVDIAPALPATLEPVIHPPASLDQCYCRSPQVALRAVSDDLFLWHATEYSYFHLNMVARAVWTLLESPASGRDIADILCEGFPDTPPAVIEADVAALLGAFAAELLVLQQD